VSSKYARKIIWAAIFIIVVVYILDASIDSLFFDNRSLWEELILAVAPKEIYNRAAIAATIVISVFVFWLVFKRGEKLQSTLIETEKKFRNLADDSPNAIFISLEHRVIYANSESENLTGYSIEEICSPDFNFIDIIAPESVEITLLSLEKHDRGMELPPYEITVIKKDGTKVDTILGTRLILVDGKRAVLGNLTDISKQKSMENELTQTKNRLSYLLEECPAVIYSCGAGPEYPTTFITENATKIFGYKPDEFYLDHRFWIDRIHPDDRGLVADKIALVEKGESVAYEYRFLKADGNYIWLHDEISPSYDNSGKMAGFVGSCFDITSRKNIEEKLWESEQMLRIVLDHIPQGVFWKDVNLRYSGYNKVFADAAGLKSSREALGKDDDYFPWKDFAEKYRADDREVLEKGKEKLDFEELFRVKDGTEKWVKTSKLPLRNKDGKIIGVIGTYEDITERKIRERQLRESRDQLYTMIDNSPTHIYIKDIRGKYKVVNNTLARLAGKKREEVVGMTDYQLHNKEIADICVANDLMVVKEKRTMEFEERIRINGKIKTLLSIKSPLFDSDGNIYGICGLSTDITERKRGENENKELVEKLQKEASAVRTLSGLIPICASCKNIRDEKGYWMKVESYISEYSDLEFSHGLCPDCAKRLYPELFIDDEF